MIEQESAAADFYAAVAAQSADTEIAQYAAEFAIKGYACPNRLRSSFATWASGTH